MAASFSSTTYIHSKTKPFHVPSITSFRNPGLRSSNISITKTAAALTTSSETSSLAPKEVSRRPTVEFHPSVWDDHFISHSPDAVKPQRETLEKIEELKKQVKTQLSSLADNPTQRLVYIDKIQRLGVAYHFEAEIGNALQYMYHNLPHQEGDLYTVSLRFRVLRQAGYPVSPSVFDKFKDGQGKFDETLSSDVEGLLSLYQAAYLRCKGEDTLDEAIAFTTNKLKSMVSNLSSPIAGQVEHALELPLHKRIQRAETRYYISVHEKEQSPLVDLAKLDYNVVQLLHQSEINEVSRWWKASNIVSKLPFQMRDRLVEGYAMMMGIFPEPKYTFGRIFTGKLFGLLTVLDDTFDVYGTLEELKPLTEAISRWRIEEKDDQMPEFVKVIAAELFSLFDEFVEEMTRRGQSNTVPYFVTQIQKYVRCLFEEAEQFHNKEIPTLEERLELGAVTVGGELLVIASVVFHWELATKETLDWAVSGADIITSCGRIGRLIDDIHTFKPELERGNIASTVTCYMKEYRVEEAEAIENLGKITEQEWMVMNKDLLESDHLPIRLLLIPIDVARLAEVYYLYGDGYTNAHAQTKELIASLLVKPVPV